MLCLRLSRWRPVQMLFVAAVLLLLPHAARTPGNPATCQLIAGGGAIMVRGYEIVFSAASDTQGSTLSGLVIVRASADFQKSMATSNQLEKWTAVRLRHPGSGANVGPLMIVHE